MAYTASSDLRPGDSFSGLAMMILIVGRSMTWGIAGLAIGIGQGVALKSGKLVMNGLLGGMLGGLLGGMFFDPIEKVLSGAQYGGQAIVSRCIGFVVIGLATGLMIGLVEHLAKSAWLLMRAGPLAGKQFIIYKSPTAIGSSPKCEVYLFKDPDVAPRHALITKAASRHEIRDMGSEAGTYVNKRLVQRQTLHDGDQIMIGGTVLEFAERSEGTP
jgi:hypothetical protein